MGRRKVIDDETLLRHAREVFLERGALGSAKEVAARAGISEAAVFKRFPSKAKLFLAALMPAKVDPATLIADDIDDPRAALTETGLRLLDYFREVIPPGLHLTTNPLITPKEIGEHFGADAVDSVTQALADFIVARAQRGQIRAENPMATASLLISSIHSLALYEMMGLHSGTDMAHAVPLFVEALYAGLAPPG